MKPLPIKSIQPWFAGLVAAFALFGLSVSAQAVAVVPLTCSNSISTKSGVVTFTATLGNGEETAPEEAFCADAFDDGVLIPGSSKDCTILRYSFEADLDDTPLVIPFALVTLSTARIVEFLSDDAKPSEAGLPPFGIRTVVFPNPDNELTLTGSITTDRIDQFLLGTTSTRLKVGKGKNTNFSFACGIAVAGPSEIVEPLTPTAQDECISFGKEEAFFARINRGRGSLVRPEDVSIFLGVPCPKVGNPLNGPFPGGISERRNNRSFSLFNPNEEAFIHRPGEDSPLEDTMKVNGFDFDLCLDFDKATPGFKKSVINGDIECKVFGSVINIPSGEPPRAWSFAEAAGSGCTYFCKEGDRDGSCSGTPFKPLTFAFRTDTGYGCKADSHQVVGSSCDEANDCDSHICGPTLPGDPLTCQ